MSRCLVITSINYEQSIHQRTHRLVERAIDYFDHVTVLHKIPFASHSLLRSLFALCLNFVWFKPKCKEIGKNLILWGASPLGFPIPINSWWYTEPYIVALKFLINNREKYDVCIAQGPWAGKIGLLLKRTGKIYRLVYEDLDLWEDFFPEGSFVRGKISRIDKECVKSSDLVVSVAEELADFRKRQGAKNIVVAHNGVSYERFAHLAPRDTGRPTIIYCGSFEEWAGIDIAIRSIPLIKKKIPDIRFLILGAGTFEKELMKLAHELELENGDELYENIFFLGKRKYEDLPRYLQRADIGLITFAPMDLTRYACPLKLYEYSAAGLPIVGTNIGFMKRMIETYQIGVTVEYSPEDIADKVITLLNSPVQRRTYSLNARKFASQYDWKLVFEKEFQAIKELSG